MIPKKEQLIRDYETGMHHTLKLFESLSPKEWLTPSLCKAWSVKDVLAHLFLKEEEAGGGSFFRSDHCQNNVSLEELRTQSEQNLLKQFRISSEKTLQALRNISELDLESVLEIQRLGKVPLYLALYFCMFEQFIHTNDILVPLKHKSKYIPELIDPSLRFLKFAPIFVVSSVSLL